MLRTVLSCLAVVVAEQAVAGFSIEGSPSVSTERGAMGGFQPYQQEARAQFRNSDAQLAPRQAKYDDAELLVDLAYKSVVQKGSGQAAMVEGFADEVPFQMAMSMILPTGWQLYKDKGFGRGDVPEAVSYLGGKTWPDVLGQIGERYALQFHVDWFDRTVYMKKGKASAIQQANRIRVIAEPVTAKPVQAVSLAKADLSSASPAQAYAAKPISPVQGVSSATAPITTATSLPRPVLKAPATPSVAAKATVAVGSQSEPKASATPVKATATVAQPAKSFVAEATPVPAVKPIEPPKPVFFSMKVSAGTLHENVVRLSREQGWNPPSWGIEGDYRISTDYAIEATGFPEAMVKLLMLHPIEADVNTAQRKIFVIKEVR